MRHLLLASTCVIGLAGGWVPPAGAQPAEPPPDRIGGIDSDRPLLLQSDTLEYDDAADVVTATGNVEVVQGERVLKARRIVYARRTGVVTAEGEIVLMEPSGEVLFADRVELTDDLREGVIEQIRVRLADDSRFAAVSGRHVGGRSTELRKAVYSPCDLCEEDPTRAPLWQLKAQKVVHDKVTKDIEYEDVFLEMWGVPVLYTPYFTHPDPTVERRSGFLAPTFGSDSDLGFMYQQPYHWAIAPNEDLTFAPIFLSKENPVAFAEYRRLFEFGQIEVEGSFGFLDQKEVNPRTGALEERQDRFRGHIRAEGDFAIDENWRAGFDLYRTTDDTYLRNLDFDNEGSLRSEAFAEYFEGRSYGIVTASTVQELRSDVDNDATPTVLPNATYSFVSGTGAWGDFWTFDANALALHRSGTPESRRLSVQGGWHLPFTTGGGHLFDLSLTARGDIYSVDGYTRSDGSASDGVTGRIYPQAMLSWRYPLVRPAFEGTVLVEPTVALVAAPDDLNPDRIPNEDSLNFEFDDTNLFSPNRFPGLDRVEGGQRVDYGVKTAWFGSDGARAEVFLGQSLRASDKKVFPSGSGLRDELSDVVGRVEAAPTDWFDVLYRFRLDTDDLSLRRSEVGFGVGTPELRLTGDYVLLDAPATTGLFRQREQVQATLSSQLTQNWYVYGSHRRDLDADDPLEYRFGISYADECFIFDASYSRTYNTDREVNDGDKILFRLVFRNLGEVQTSERFGG